MGKHTIAYTLSAILVSMASAGCANKANQRIVLLEDSNRDLAQRLNLAVTERGAVLDERDELHRQLALAYDEAERCHDLLAARPETPPEERAPAGWTAVPGGAMIAIDGNVLFAPGKTVLRDQARRVLSGIASTIQGQYGDKDVLVFGHTDNQPIKKSGWTDNWQLSTERSLAVVRFLKQNGISAGRLIAGGCGEHRPRAANNSSDSRSANRRVEIFALDAQALAARP